MLRFMCAACVLIGLPATLLAEDAPSPVGNAPPHMAVYRWAAPKGVPQVDAFAQWIGRPEIWAEDFAANDTWDGLANPAWLIGPWGDWVQARDGRKLLFSLPMLAGGWDRSGPHNGTAAKKPVSFASGAAGEYDAYFRKLAENLVKHGLADRCIIRLGWEFNGGWYVWRVGARETADFRADWRRIVKTMRAVPGADKLQFCWNPALMWMPYSKADVYPGDEFVDFIGLDVYDQSWAKDTYPIPDGATDAQVLERQKRTWDQVLYGGNDGLHVWPPFAAEHHKPLAICEWGACIRADKHGGGDNPYFIEQMHKFIADPRNHVAFHCYFDVEAPDGGHQLSPGVDGKYATHFPKAAAKFKELFGGAGK